MRHPGTVLQAYRRGERIEGDELVMLKMKMEQLADLCNDFGPMFDLTYAYANKVRNDCHEFLQNRKERP